ncbi:MAG TPA: universal stress protein [Fimbriiglobus sp.]|jgi:nucleotide-binding universal stress UspA family protein
MPSYKKILFPTDYSRSSVTAFEVACGLARDYRAEMVVCHVAPPPIPAVADGMVFDIPTGEEKWMTEKLKAVRPTESGIRVTHRPVRGEAAREILGVAEACRADLIVMGTHGRTGLSRLLLGSVAEAVLRSAKCPVVTVRSFPPEEAEVETKGN